MGAKFQAWFEGKYYRNTSRKYLSNIQQTLVTIFICRFERRQLQILPKHLSISLIQKKNRFQSQFLPGGQQGKN